MSRRRGSATALNASEVVAALAMHSIYAHIGICQALFWPIWPRSFSSAACAKTERNLRCAGRGLDSNTPSHVARTFALPDREQETGLLPSQDKHEGFGCSERSC